MVFILFMLFYKPRKNVVKMANGKKNFRTNFFMEKKRSEKLYLKRPFHNLAKNWPLN